VSLKTFVVRVIETAEGNLSSTVGVEVSFVDNRHEGRDLPELMHDEVLIASRLVDVAEGLPGQDLRVTVVFGPFRPDCDGHVHPPFPYGGCEGLDDDQSLGSSIAGISHRGWYAFSLVR